MKSTTIDKISPRSKRSGINAGRTSYARRSIGVLRVKALIPNLKSHGNRFKASTEWTRKFYRADADEQLAMLGDRDGAQWARQTTKGELRRLAQAWYPQYDWYFGVGGSAYNDAERFVFMIHPDPSDNRTAASEFCDTKMTGEWEMPVLPYVQAFGQGDMGI